MNEFNISIQKIEEDLDRELGISFEPKKKVLFWNKLFILLFPITIPLSCVFFLLIPIICLIHYNIKCLWTGKNPLNENPVYFGRSLY